MNVRYFYSNAHLVAVTSVMRSHGLHRSDVRPNHRFECDAFYPALRAHVRAPQPGR